ncbi:MAG: beta-ketoacyl-[acyl-carrier-protein] synthase family protein [Planctomycetes bacterium]|nr:beta-ketoacyl-[acyl-carrier-protein] synthase family protein [Planctomycetota bacterium]
MTGKARAVILADAAAMTALGASLDETWEGLLAGRSAVSSVTRFSTEHVAHHVAACIADLDGLRRAGENRTLALARAAALQLRALPAGTFLIWTGLKGNAEPLDEAQGGAAQALAEPWRARHYRERLAAALGLDPENGMEVSAACASSTVGLALGAGMIRSGERDSVLVCAADIVSRFAFLGFSALQALSSSACRPFDVARDGLCLGDGAAAVLLASEETAKRHGLERDIRLAGFGVANDATHITGPAADGRGLARAMRAALLRAGVLPDVVEAFCAHGTGTPYNDSMELSALEDVFGARRFPVFSIKGALGHALGATGALEAALSAWALRRGLAPPTAGLLTPETRAAGRAAAAPQRFAGRNLLTVNSGFGGVNAALLLERCA